jgi:membrane protein DedA with SNARE-associated domain
MSVLLSQALEITSTFNFKIAIILFLLCSIGEIGFALPYVLETIWLLAGYQLGTHTLFPVDLLKIWLVAQAGRQTGSLVLYYSGRLGMRPLTRLYKRYIEPNLPKRQIIPAGLIKHLTNPSPLSIAMGRLIGLRFPMALTVSARKRLANLALGVLISSIVWDGVYLIIGSILGPKVVPEKQNILLYSIAGLTLLYLTIIGTRLLIKYLISQKKKPAAEG